METTEPRESAPTVFLFWNGDLGTSRKSAIEIREKASQNLDFKRKFDWIRGEASQDLDFMRKFDWNK